MLHEQARVVEEPMRMSEKLNMYGAFSSEWIFFRYQADKKLFIYQLIVWIWAKLSTNIYNHAVSRYNGTKPI